MSQRLTHLLAGIQQLARVIRQGIRQLIGQINGIDLRLYIAGGDKIRQDLRRLQPELTGDGRHRPVPIERRILLHLQVNQGRERSDLIDAGRRGERERLGHGATHLIHRFPGDRPNHQTELLRLINVADL